MGVVSVRVRVEVEIRGSVRVRVQQPSIAQNMWSRPSERPPHQD